MKSTNRNLINAIDDGGNDKTLSAEPGISHKKLSELTPDSRNANKGSERGNAMIQASLRDYGAGRSILLDKHGRIIAGNKTSENAQAMGMTDVIIVQTTGEQVVAVQRMDLDLEEDSKAKALAIADNRAGEVSLNWDPEVLKELQAEGVPLAEFWDPSELVVFFAAPKLQGDEDDAPDAPETPTTREGDVWILGNHRLMCGDSTDEKQVAYLMAGEFARCMWTDPPYGVNYAGKTKDALTIQNDGSEGLADLLDGAFSCATTALEPGAAIYVAHPAGALSITFGNAFLKEGWRMHQTLVWDKTTMVLGHSDYHYAHEPIFYGYMPGSGRYGRGGKGWYGDDSQRSILSYPKPSRSESHPTMKPVALIEHCLKNSTQFGHIVLDLFGGSGSTLIACEKLERKARLMEIDPRFVDVIVARWEAATGRKAVLDAQT